MAVISELIDAGLSLKEQGNHQAAIEHFRQLNVTYPDHARIMFELAGSWQAFNVPEQALPLYRRLMAMPKSQSLQPKDMPRLYTQMGATLRMLGQFAESLEIIDEGLTLYPEYRPLRAYRMFALHSAGFHQNAMTEALELMLESLAPTKWDLYEEEIIDIVRDIRQRVPRPDTDDLADWEFDEFWSEEGKKIKPETDDDNENDDVPIDDIVEEAHAIVENGDAEDNAEDDESEATVLAVVDDAQNTQIEVEDDNDDDDSFEIKIKIVDKADPKPKKSTKKPKTTNQMGKKPVKIDIGHEDEEDDEVPSIAEATEDNDSDDNAASPSGKINIPIDLD